MIADPAGRRFDLCNRVTLNVPTKTLTRRRQLRLRHPALVAQAAHLPSDDVEPCLQAVLD
jgi:hypothetical protein